MTFNDCSMSLTEQSFSELLIGVMNNFASLLNGVRNLANKNYLLNFKTNKVLDKDYTIKDYTITARIDNTIMNINHKRWRLHTMALFNAERQAGKLRIAIY